jgi:hypothetical protein
MTIRDLAAAYMLATLSFGTIFGVIVAAPY